MTGGDVVRPFRWDVTQRSQLGTLPEVELPETYAGFEDDLLACSARLIAFAGDVDLVFVGRSPHAIFDVRLFDLGQAGDVRRRFTRALAAQPAMTESWFRSLTLEIKR